MDGIHDLGGMGGFSRVSVEDDEPTFHHPWEALAFSLNLLSISALRAYNVDEYRHSIERMAPAHYLNASYYERTLTGVATLLVEKEVVSHERLEELARGTFPLAQPVASVTADGRKSAEYALFEIGDRVRVRTIHPRGHTRVPRYVRGVCGEVLHVTRPVSFPDAAAHGLPFRREPTYHVLFEAKDLWPEDEGSGETVVVDLWETYLEAAQ